MTDKLRELVEKWRTWDWQEKGPVNCADELEEALNAEPQASDLEHRSVGTHNIWIECTCGFTCISGMTFREHCDEKNKSIAQVRAESSALLAQKDAEIAELVYAARGARDWFTGAVSMDKHGEHDCYRADPVALDMLNVALQKFEHVVGKIPARAALNPQQKSEGGT